MREASILADNVAKNFLTREISQNTEDQLMRESSDNLANKKVLKYFHACYFAPAEGSLQRKKYQTFEIIQNARTKILIGEVLMFLRGVGGSHWLWRIYM